MRGRSQPHHERNIPRNGNNLFNSTGLNCLYFNARSLCNKLPSFELLLKSETYDLVLVTESWLNSCIPDPLVSGGGLYRIFRNDRQTCKGGGVALFTRKCLAVTQVDLPGMFCSIETIIVDVQGATPLRMVCIYNPPDCSVVALNLLCQFLSVISDVVHPVIIVGDFNLPKIIFNPSLEWPNFAHPNSEIYNTFSNTMVTCGLTQVANEPTHCLGNWLDLVLCSDPLYVSCVKVSTPFCTSDHKSIHFLAAFEQKAHSATSNPTQHFTTFEKWTYKHLNFTWQISYGQTSLALAVTPMIFGTHLSLLFKLAVTYMFHLLVLGTVINLNTPQISVNFWPKRSVCGETATVKAKGTCITNMQCYVNVQSKSMLKPGKRRC